MYIHIYIYICMYICMYIFILYARNREAGEGIRRREDVGGEGVRGEG